jgi:catechol 2,3-dioxygenase-like lactoylglutathione lyase family enzyme
MKLDHVALNVENISSAVEWYGKEYDGKTLYQDETWALMLIGDTKIAFTISSHHPAHIGFCVDSISSFPEGAEVKSHRDGSTYCYRSDPWGNVIEFIKY